MTTRRNAVSRALLAVAGSVGLGAAAGGAKFAPSSATSTLVLRGRNLRTSGGRHGEVPSDGERISVSGDLIDATDGKNLGEFYSAGFAIGGGLHPAHGERLELHTFKLSGGTIIGSGTAGQLDGVFAILGGTGRYAGARGTYVARQRLAEYGGDGSAEFVLDLTR